MKRAENMYVTRLIMTAKERKKDRRKEREKAEKERQRDRKKRE